MKIHAGLPPGVNALLFEAGQARRRLEARLSARLEHQGFSEVLLPILDYFDPYEPLLSESSRDRLYRFVDRDGQLLALRGDFTPMLARLIAPRLSALELPLRLFYRGDVVRYQEVRPGRMREYSELGIELLDLPGREHDEQVLSLFVELLIVARGAADPSHASDSALRIVVSKAGALDALVLGLGGDSEALAAIARRDREVARRMSAELAEIVEAGLPQDLGCLGDSNAAPVTELLELCQRLEGRFGELGVQVALDLAEFAANTLDPALEGDSENESAARNRSYYDGIVFTAYRAGETHPVGRGGRYDRLFAALGAEVSATGFSLGLDRLVPSSSSADRLDGSDLVSESR